MKLFATTLLLCFSLSWAKLNHNQFLNFEENETAIQLKLFDQAIRIERNAAHINEKQPLSLVLAHMDVSHHNQWSEENVTVSELIVDHSRFVRQTKSGIKYNSNTMLTFWCNTTQPETTHLMLKVSNGTPNSSFVGLIAPFQKDETSGERNVTLVDNKNIPVGVARVTFLVIRPSKDFVKGPQKFDIQPDNGLNNLTLMGHRGTGVFVRDDLPQKFVENTIDGFNYACDHGAHMIELDVQLTSDGVPVIYHDFAVTTFIHKRQFNDLKHNFTHKIPLKDLSKKKLDMINTNFMPTVGSHQNVSHQSFETLEDVLKGIRPHCGINVEIKYPQMFEDGHWDGERGFELNKYVDSILHVLNENHRNRKIVITSFHPDLSVMVQLKQKRFQVAFLTSGDRSINNPKAHWIRDPRSRKVDSNVAFAQAANFHGLSLLALDVITYPANIHFIRDRNMSLYLWGNQLDSWKLITSLHKAGVNGFIFDHLDKIVPQH